MITELPTSPRVGRRPLPRSRSPVPRVPAAGAVDEESNRTTCENRRGYSGAGAAWLRWPDCTGSATIPGLWPLGSWRDSGWPTGTRRQTRTSIYSIVIPYSYRFVPPYSNAFIDHVVRGQINYLSPKKSFFLRDVRL